MARGRPLLDLFGERSLKLLFYDVIDSEGPFDETREIAVDGETRHFKIIADELTGEVNGMFIDVTDITPVIAAKLEADDARDAAEQANRAKSDFLARMSHEIRTPMNAIIGMGDLMRTDNLDQTQTGYFDDIKRSSKALLQIINDILDFSKVEAGKLDILPVDFSLRTLYDNLCSLNTFTAGVKDLDFLSRMGEDVPDIVFGDEIRVRQIVTNLLNNAVKYTRRGYVSFTMRKAPELGESFVGFVVEDSGVGIREEDMSRLFGTFEQFDVAANRGIVGSGLGLSIVKRLTDLMGGRVEVASEYGKGSRFAVYLPLPPGDPEKIEQSYDITRVIADSGTSVLVVDDNDMNINVARAFLATHGIEADIARSGYEAIDKVRDGHYDLVFMDHMMPEIDGLKATQIIRGFEDIRFRSIPIIALTANAVVGERKAFLTAGMSDYLAKPIMAPDMNRMLQKWLPPERILRYENIRTNAAGERVERGVGADGGMLINRTVGLERSAKNEKLYAQLLRDFVKNHRDTFKRITQGLVDGDIALAHRLAHTLKSTAWMIGAEALGDAALAVEEGLSNGELHCTDSQLFSLRQELGFVIAEIGVEERAGSAADEFDWDAGSGGSNAGGANAGGGAGANANGKPGGGLNTNMAADADEPKAAPGASGGTDAAPDGDAASEREVAVPFSVARALDLMDRLDPLIRSHRTAAADLSEEIVETLGPLGEGAAELAGQLENYRFGDAAELLRALRERVRSASSGQLDGSCGDRGGANRDSGGE
jgi:signal transduction histidine kinase/DNA-binding NarL/FixJ family response regulator